MNNETLRMALKKALRRIFELEQYNLGLANESHNLQEENRRLRAENVLMREALEDVEWVGVLHMEECPWCGANAWDDDGELKHKPDCLRQKALKHEI